MVLFFNTYTILVLECNYIKPNYFINFGTLSQFMIYKFGHFYLLQKLPIQNKSLLFKNTVIIVNVNVISVLTRIIAGIGDYLSIIILETSKKWNFVICIFEFWNWRISFTKCWINTTWNELWELVTFFRPNPIWQSIRSLSLSANDADLICRVDKMVEGVVQRGFQLLTFFRTQATIFVQVWNVENPI